ncbi:MAG TPA: aspartate dehydrogenase [Candidatus Bathyarchaeia archaeon]|nr:aspartate dehydrogenase [Candidatus Bathyarchaeia archaeon]
MIIGIIGCGAIGTEICRALAADGFSGKLLLFDRHPERAQRLADATPAAFAVTSLSDLIDQADLVVECASKQAARDTALTVLASDKDLMLLSVGALVDADFRNKVYAAAHAHECRVYIPSGAIGGVDALLAAAQGTISRVTLTTTKPSAGLESAPYVVRNAVDLSRPALLFEGSANEAIQGFPQNINVSATLALAGVGFDRTTVRIAVDPASKRNVHVIEVEGDFGMFKAQFDNVPTENERTSKLAAYSAVASLKKIMDAVRLGT